MFGLDPLPRSLEASLRDARDPKVWVRRSAVSDLARHGSGEGRARAVEALLEVLASDPSAEVRAAAAVALADARAENATSALVDALGDATERVRQMALLALGEVGDPEDPRLVAAIEEALDGESAPERFQALIAGARLDLASSATALVRKTRDPDREVRHVAFRLLEERASDADGSVRPSPEVRQCAREGLTDESLSVRTAAAILLARAQDPAGDDVIAEACGARSGVLDAEDEQAAIELAGTRQLQAARPALTRRAFGALGLPRSPFAYAARIALARMGDARAASAILRGLSAWSRDARTLSVVAAGRARLEGARALLLALRGDPRRAEPEAVEEALSLLDAASS